MVWGQIASAVISAYAASEANRAREDQSAEAREWQTMMANTAHQREVRDLRKAGLNPILSAGGGTGAVAPSTQLPVIESIGDGVAGAVSSANAMKRLDAELYALNAQAIRDDTQAGKNTADAELAGANKANAVKQGEILDETLRGVRLDNQYKQLGIPGARIESEIDDSSLGESTRRINRVMDTISPIINSAVKARGGK